MNDNLPPTISEADRVISPGTPPPNPIEMIPAISREVSSHEFALNPNRNRAWGTGVLLFVILAIVGVSAPYVYEYWAELQRDAYKSKCALALKAKQWDKLLARSKEWRQWSPKDDDPLMFIAQAAVEMEQLEVAADALGQVDNSYHGALQALATRAEILQSELNLPFDAEATWLRMLEIRSDADLPRQRLIYFYAMTLQRHKLAAQIEAAIRLGCEPPEAYVYLIMKDSLSFSDGQSLTTKWRMTSPDNEVLEAAQAVYAGKQTEGEMVLAFASQTTSPKVDAMIDACLEKYPQNLELLVIKLDRAVFEGDVKSVIKLIGQAPAEAQVDSRFWRSKGWLLSANGRQEEAATSLRRAIELNPFDWQARWILADVLRKVGKNEDSDRISQIALQGKVLQRHILARPDARDLDDELLLEIRQYLRNTSPEWILAAFERRVE